MHERGKNAHDFDVRVPEMKNLKPRASFTETNIAFEAIESIENISTRIFGMMQFKTLTFITYKGRIAYNSGIINKKNTDK